MQQVSQNMGKQFIVDNRPGAGGTLGSAEVARAAADGYTLLFTSSTHVIAPQLMANVPYDPVNDFTPVVHLADAPLILLVPRTLNVKSTAELITLAKKQPNILNYGSSGNGTTVHLTTEAFKAQAGVSITHVPYKGNSLATPDLIAGNIQVLFDALPSGMPHVKEGRLRALAITSLQRSPLAPEIPTLAEAGLPGFVAVPWFGLYGPRGMNAKLVQAIHDEFAKALQSAALRSRLATLGAEPGGGTPVDFAELAAADRVRWSKVIKGSKITID
jgi:tripartite-type tricarboxylate transporter receptor subunit TctC